MAEKQFKWLTATCYWQRGPALEKGKTYSVSQFDEGVVAYWVEEKAAEYVKEKKGGGE